MESATTIRPVILLISIGSRLKPVNKIDRKREISMMLIVFDERDIIPFLIDERDIKYHFLSIWTTSSNIH